MSPLVSIVIPSYNAANYLREAIDSCIRQVYRPIEIIVIDDGSTDSSLDILRSFGDQIRWETRANQGACAARNRGVEISNGEFIQYLDADDIFYPNKLQRQMPMATQRERTMVFCDAETIGPPHPHHVRTDSTEDSVIFMLRGGLQTSAGIHRKTWLTEIEGFRKELPCAQELDLQLRIACKGIHFERIPEKLYAVRRVPNSISSNLSRVLDQFESIFTAAYTDLENQSQLTDRRKHEFAGAMARAARAYVRLHERDKAKHYYDVARRMHPSGGIDLVFGKTMKRVCEIFGPEFAEWLSGWKRQWNGAGRS